MLHHLQTVWHYLTVPTSKTSELVAQEIKDEITFHLEERIAEETSRGVALEEAQRRAKEKFGDTTRIAAECHRVQLGGLSLCHRLHLIVTLSLLVAVGLLWYQVRLQSISLPTAIASMTDNDWTGDIRGIVVNKSGSAIRNANVLIVVKTWPDRSYFQRAYTAITDYSGRFSIENVYPTNEHYEVHITAAATHAALVSAYYQRDGGELPELRFDLPHSVGLSLRIESEHGIAVSGIEVMPCGRVEKNGTEHLVYMDSAHPLVRRTDEQGLVQFPFFQPGDTADLMVRHPDGEWEKRDLVVPSSGRIAKIRTSRSRSVEEDS